VIRPIESFLLFGGCLIFAARLNVLCMLERFLTATSEKFNYLKWVYVLQQDPLHTALHATSIFDPGLFFATLKAYIACLPKLVNNLILWVQIDVKS
jgi:hypothetical protein